MRLGIDFGTTRSVVAWCDRGNFPVVSFTSETDDLVECYPSVVAESEGELRFGFDALRMANAPSCTMLRSFKRILSDPEAGPRSLVRIGDAEILLAELLTRFITALKQDLLSSSNLSKIARRDNKLQAVVAVPANAHSTQRFMTIDAFRQAGFEVLGLVNEPSAAGFEYTHRYRDTITSRREHVVVYDLGGGTFDVSLIRINGFRHEVVATAGVGRLGGDDFDRALAEMALAHQGLSGEGLAPRAFSLLIERCRLAKEMLNPNSRRIVIDLEGIIDTGGAGAEVTLATADFYEACDPLIERSIQAMAPVLQQDGCAELLDDTDLSDIAGIYVVGGASSLPAVGRTLRKRFGRRVHRSPYPSAATAIGLAIAADENAGFALTDRFSRTFGLFREAACGQLVSFDPIITQNTPLPEQGAPDFVLSRIYRPTHNIGHFRYVECSSVSDDGSPCGEMTPFADIRFPFDPALRAEGVNLEEIPVERSLNPGPQIEERYSVDANGIVELTIRDLDNGYERSRRLL